MQLETETARQPVGELQGLGYRHLRRLRDRQVARARRILEQLAHARCLRRNRSHARDRSERARRLEHPERVPRGRRVEHDQLVASPPACSPALCQLPDLHHADQLFGARGGGREVLERTAFSQDPSRHPAAERLQPLQQRLVWVDRDRPQHRRQLRLGSRLWRSCSKECRQPCLLTELDHERAHAGPL